MSQVYKGKLTLLTSVLAASITAGREHATSWFADDACSRELSGSIKQVGSTANLKIFAWRHKLNDLLIQAGRHPTVEANKWYVIRLSQSRCFQMQGFNQNTATVYSCRYSRFLPQHSVIRSRICKPSGGSIYVKHDGLTISNTSLIAAQ